MRTSISLYLAALTATLVLAGAVGSASARSLSVSETGFRITFSSLEFGSSVVTVRCRLTLEGSFHRRSGPKIPRSLIGTISRAIVAHPGCSGGEAWVDNGTESEPLGTAPNRLPFHLTYESFGGILPRITEINFSLNGASLVLQTSFIGIACRGRYGRAEDNITAHAALGAGGAIGSVTPDSTSNRASLVGALVGSTCPTTGSFSATSNAPTSLSSGSPITVTLI